MRRQTRALNRYSMWHYLVILISLGFLMLNALPNIYAERPVIKVSTNPQVASSELVGTQLYQWLNEEGIEISFAEVSDSQATLTLANTSEQQHAQAVLNKHLGEQAEVVIAMQSSGPAWLARLGLSPLQLGLDLRGGVQFLLEVDTQQAINESLAQQRGELNTLLREQGARGARVLSNDQQQLELSFPVRVAEQTMAALNAFQSNFPEHEVRQQQAGLFTINLAGHQDFHQALMMQNLQTLRDRVAALGITEAVVQRQGHNFIRIELPGVQDPAQAKRVIGATATISFHALSANGDVHQHASGDPVGIDARPILTGQKITNASAQFGEFGMPEVLINLDSAGGNQMSDFSRQNIGQPMATLYTEYLENEAGVLERHSKVISVATIQAHLGSRFTITGMDSVQATQDLALLLKAGSLSAPISIVEERLLGPSLGEQNISNGFAALALGMGLMLAFMLVWYRGLGLIANIALVLNLVCLIGLLSLVPGAVLTLPGIAGLVLTIGMATDTNVLIFERIKEERRRGLSEEMAVHHGYKNAFSTIFDASFTSLIIAAILFSVGFGPIKGFAITFGLGLLTSMFTGVYVSRSLVNLQLAWRRKAALRQLQELAS
ncbi:protein translocase subunit SecD [Agarivorans aestuarii]|uniref:protein translocase subunit SecD n=1 Tax=Agarivorans aestuarii TaxID=1563703 RepID=UPI001C80C817|nr:protein translocase subunit SecD [Agarivorans aestuarii]